jgi:thiol-disulfide isomerase/thioredoxin
LPKLVNTLLACLLTATTLFATTATAAEKAVDFQFTDTKGKTLRLSDFTGKWVLVNFWAPWCPLCWAETPTLNKLNKRKDFVVIGIGLDYGPDANVVQGTADRHNIEVTAIVAGGSRRDPTSPLRQVGPVDFFPTSYLYDPTGEIVMFIPGQVREHKILGFMEDWKRKRGGKR